MMVIMITDQQQMPFFPYTFSGKRNRNNHENAVSTISDLVIFVFDINLIF